MQMQQHLNSLTIVGTHVFSIFVNRDISDARIHVGHLKWPAASLARDEMTDEKVFRSGSSCSACKLSNNCMVASWYLHANKPTAEDTPGDS